MVKEHHTDIKAVKLTGRGSKRERDARRKERIWEQTKNGDKRSTVEIVVTSENKDMA